MEKYNYIISWSITLAPSPYHPPFVCVYAILLTTLQTLSARNEIIINGLYFWPLSATWLQKDEAKRCVTVTAWDAARVVLAFYGKHVFTATGLTRSDSYGPLPHGLAGDQCLRGQCSGSTVYKLVGCAVYLGAEVLMQEQRAIWFIVKGSVVYILTSRPEACILDALGWWNVTYGMSK